VTIGRLCQCLRDPPGIPTDAILARKRDSAAIGQQNAQPRAASDDLEWVCDHLRRHLWRALATDRTTAEELEELRPVADTEQHHMRSGMDDQRFLKNDLPPARESASALSDRSSAFFSALLTEQFVQQSVRGVTVSESSSRASLYMFTLSSALIAYGFLADTDVAAAYLGVVLPIVFLLGIFTWERLVQTALEDVIAVGVIQRIRRYYATLLPGAEYFFPQPTDRTAVHELLDIGTRSSWRGVVFTASSAILTVNCIVGGTGIALALHEAGLMKATSIVIGVLAGLVIFIALASYQLRRFRRVKAAVTAA
jgi:hypothetical protein